MHLYHRFESKLLLWSFQRAPIGLAEHKVFLYNIYSNIVGVKTSYRVVWLQGLAIRATF